MTLSPESRHPVCLIEVFGARPHLCLEEPWRDDVDTGEVSPFTGNGLSEMRNKGLATVVDGLIDRHIDDVPAHAGGDDQVAEALVAEDLADVFGAVEDAIDCLLLSRCKESSGRVPTVDGHLLAVFFQGGV